jgi:hypothetical protein
MQPTGPNIKNDEVDRKRETPVRNFDSNALSLAFINLVEAA